MSHTPRAQQMGQHLAAERIDRVRDAEFYTPAERFISNTEVNELIEVLVGTEDSIEVGLSQIGIDPEQFDESDLNMLCEELAERGVSFNDEWVRE